MAVMTSPSVTPALPAGCRWRIAPLRSEIAGVMLVTGGELWVTPLTQHRAGPTVSACRQ